MSRGRPDAARVRAAAPLFAALGDETRLGLLGRLSSGGPESTRRLRAVAPVSRQAIEKHLDVLASVGLVRSQRRGRERVWELEPRRLEDAHRFLALVSRRWDQALERLRRHLEEE